MNAIETPAIQKTPGVCGGKACIRDTRIAVWILVMDRKLGQTDAQVLDSYPSLTPLDIDAAWSYYRANPVEIERTIWFNDTAANVPDGSPPPAWVIVSGSLLGLSDGEIREAFEPPLPSDAVEAAWAAFRADPRHIGREATLHRIAG